MIRHDLSDEIGLLFADNLSLIKIIISFQFVNSILSDGDLLVTLVFSDGFLVKFKNSLKNLVTFQIMTFTV